MQYKFIFYLLPTQSVKAPSQYFIKDNPILCPFHSGIECQRVRQPDWVDPFEDKVVAAAKRASYQAHLIKAKTAALTIQAKAERTLANVAKARRMLANPILSSGHRAQLVIHCAKG
jgi:hypothetical protein